MPKFIRRLLRLIAGTSLFWLTMFGAAGRLDWPGAWALIVFFFLFLFFVLVWGTRNAPELLDERGSRAANVPHWDKIIMTTYRVMVMVLMITAALDAGRFRWSHMPVGVQAFGGSIVFLGSCLVFWCFRTNAFLSSDARIQADRGHCVVRGGPYRYVRHPMYIALIVLMPSVALLLGSWWAVIPAGVIVVLFFVRTALEDRMLRAELAGYEEYAASVRYRLVPGIW
jgi:protein-S-isoprenylcysteine O-methyltransferase Ste14